MREAMKTLLIMRHAKSSWKEQELPDHDRPLKKRGRKDIINMAKILKKKALIPELILSSSAVRAKDTATLMAEKLNYKGEVELVDDLYMAEPETYIQKIATVPDKVEKLLVVGDTRFDRVYQKSIVAKERKLINEDILKNKKVIVAGSTWEEDEDVIIPIFKKLVKYQSKDLPKDELLFIIAPHEPTLIHLEKLENDFNKSLKTIRFSYLNNYSNENVIIIDSIGILSTLYYYADIAFVGGSFKSNVHNVLEAAVYGIPVLYGPKIFNSQEAKRLNEIGGGIIIHNQKEGYRMFKTLLMNDELRDKLSKVSKKFVEENLGATDKILKVIYKYL